MRLPALILLTLAAGCGSIVEPKPPRCVDTTPTVESMPGVTAPPPIVTVRYCVTG